MSACKIIAIVLTVLGILSTAIATFAPGWFMLNASGQHIGVGLIAICENGQCAIYQGNATVYLVLMIGSCVLQAAGVILCLLGQAHKNSLQLKIAGAIQFFGGLACFATTVLFTVSSEVLLGDEIGILSILHFGYSYGLAWAGGVLVISAAVANLFTVRETTPSPPPHIPMY